MHVEASGRSEYLFADELLIWLSRYLFDDLGKQKVAEIRVSLGLSRHEADLMAEHELVEVFLYRRLVKSHLKHDVLRREQRIAVESSLMPEKMLDCDLMIVAVFDH